MKIGITLKESYREILEEYANVNDISITAFCGLIVENFLTFNRKNKRLPLFSRQVHLSFAQQDTNGIVDDHYINEKEQRELDEMIRVAKTPWLEDE